MSLGSSIPQDGKIKVSLINETAQEAYFDELEIVISNKPTTKIVQENNYYPFGLNMRGLEKVGDPNDLFQYNKKEKDEDTELLDYHARLQNPQTGRFEQVDPHAIKYSNISSFAYVVNNPMRFIDPNGKDIIGTDGKPVTYKINNGEVSWSKNASADVQRIGNALLYTETGTKMLNHMIDSEVRITLKISNEVKLGSNGQLRRGDTQITDYVKNKDGKYEAKVAKITIYEGSIKKHREKNAENNYYKALNTDDKAIAGVAAHEAHHATDKENVDRSTKQQLDKIPYPEREDKPHQIQKQVAEETFRKDNKKQD